MMLLVGGILNLLCPIGIGALVAGCAVNSSQLIMSGIFQLICSFLVFGVVWSIIHGILMIVASSPNPTATTPAAATGAPPVNQPPAAGPTYILQPPPAAPAYIMHPPPAAPGYTLQPVQPGPVCTTPPMQPA